ncbi:hypothetical protein VTN77DRAFT_8772 [Rasamsonia byssochlamydoides]|uniref:uncharacterized protein n=1 Tax=Rasamsonia byssochlamydoides TaxID=89139 RepID=UPI003743303B
MYTGPIVRISPSELHIDDPEYYEVLYSRDSPRNKSEYYAKQFSTPLSILTAADHYRHRLLRSNMNPFFSMARIRRLEPAIQTLVDELCSRLSAFRNTGRPVVIHNAFTCFATDVITSYVLGEDHCYLDEPDFAPQWCSTISSGAKTGLFFRHFPWLHPVVKALPEHWLAKMDPGVDLVYKYMHRCLRLIHAVIDSQGDCSQSSAKSDPSDQPTFFHDVLSSNLPPEEKTPERLAQEMMVVIGAGAETTAKTLSVITFYLLDNPEKLQKLKQELDALDPDQTASLVQFEQMPYLTSVILEGLRLSYGLSTRLQRVAPDRALKYKDWTIPPNTPVGMTSVFMHHNESIFPDSHSFNPERWLDPQERKRLDRYMVAFTKGSRQCIGMNLARAEMLLVIPKIVRHLNLRLFETTVEDVRLAHDFFLPAAKLTSKGVRVVVTEE